MKTLMRCVLLAFVCVAAGCGTYRQDYAYDPAAVMSGPTRPRLMASIFGVLRGSSTEPAGVDVRLRLEAGEETAEVIREDLQLVTADLVHAVAQRGGKHFEAHGHKFHLQELVAQLAAILVRQPAVDALLFPGVFQRAPGPAHALETGNGVIPVRAAR